MVVLAFAVFAPTARASQAPVAQFSATPNPVVVGGTVEFDASGEGGITLWGGIGKKFGSFDPDGTISSYDWDLDNDGSFDDATDSTAARVFSSLGTFRVRLRVTDNSLDTDIAYVDVLVTTQPPVANLIATPAAPYSLENITLNAAGSTDLDDAIVKYEWDFDGNGTYDANTGGTSSTTHAYATPGTRTVVVRVTDASDATDTASISVGVLNLDPTANFTAPTVADAGAALNFNASSSGDADGSIARYRWDWDGNGIFDVETSSPTIAHVFPANGIYTVKLLVIDNLNATDEVTLIIVVTGAPTASLAILTDPAVAGSPVTFDGSSSFDSDGSIVKYEWDLDDNGSFETSTGLSPTATKTYPNPGVLTVSLRVTDDNGGQNVATDSVDLAAPAASEGSGGEGSSGSGGSAGGGSGGDADDGPPSTSDAVVASLSGTSIQKLRPVLKKGLSMGCRSDRAVRCRLTLQIGGRRPVTVGRVVVTLDDAGAKTVKVKLSARGKRLLRRARSVQLLVRGSATDADGNKIALRRLFLLRR